VTPRRILGTLALLALPLLAETPLAAQDGFGVPEELADHAILSCRELSLSGGAVVTSEGLRTGAAEGEQGHVRSNQGVVLDGGVEVHGDAVPGPGTTVTFHGQPSLVTGSTDPADQPFDCAPIDLAALRADLEASNDNPLVPSTGKGNPALGGDDGRALRLSGRDSLVLPAGSYLLSELRLTGNSSLTVEGPVRLLVTGSIDVQGGSHLNLDGNPYELLVFSAGDSVSMASYAALHGFLYAPAAEVDLTGRSRVVGGVQGDRVEVSGGARVRRTVDDAPPELEVTSPVDGQTVETCEIPVAGRAADGEGEVWVTVNGAPAEVGADGAFTGTASLWSDDPGLVVVEATDDAGNVTRVEIRVSIVPPEATLLSPAPGSLVGERVVDLSGRAGTATELTVDGVPAELSGDGTFVLPGFDLGEDGLVTLSLIATNCGGSVTATAVLDLDTQAPVVAIDVPSEGALFGATPIQVGGTVTDAHLDRVTVGGVVATVEGGRFQASGVTLTEGANTLVAVAADVLGRSTTSAGVEVELDTTAPTIDIVTPASGAVVGTPTIAVTGEASDPNLASVTVGGVTAQLSGSSFSASGVTLQEGENFLVAEAVDSLGNASQSPSVVVVLDTVAPTIAIDAASLPELTADGTVTVGGTVSDPHLDTVTVNGVEATVVDETFSAEGVVLSEGANAIVAQAVDTLGHTSATAPVTVTRDTLPPEVDVTEPEPGAELSSRTVTVRGTVVEPHLDEVIVAGVPATVSDGVFVAEGVELPEGESQIVARAVDVLGHTAESQPVGVVVDTLAPVVRLTSPQNPLVTTPTVDVTGQVEEPHLDSVTVAGVPAELGEPEGDSTPFSAPGIALAEGPNEITATARDTLGHEAVSQPVLYVLDTQAPEIAILEPSDGQVVASADVAVRGTVADPNLDTVTVSGIAATVAEDGTFTAVVPAADLTDGGNVLTAVATDLAGHVGEASVSVLLDTLPPAVSVDTPPAGACLPGGAPVTLAGVFVDTSPATGLGGQPPAVQVVVVSSDGTETAHVGELTDGGARWRVPGVDLGGVDGTATATVVGTDVLGNASRAVVSWRIDATAPSLVLTLDGGPFPGAAPGPAPEPGSEPGATPALLGRTLALGARVEDGDAAAPPVATLTLDGAPYTAGTPISSEGEHLVVATVTDCAGQGAAAHAYFRIDRSAPTLVSTDPAAGSRRTAAVTTFSGVAGEPLSAALVDGRPAAIDGTGFALAPFDWTEGANEVAIELVDLAGNRSSHAVEFKVRTVPLSVEILESGAPLAEGTVFVRPARPEPRASDSRASLTATLDGAPFVLGSEVAEEGPHHLVATAEDDWGRSATVEVRFTVDLGTGPEIAITHPADGAILDGATTAVSGTVTGDPVSVTVNGAPAVVTGGTWSLGSLALETNVSTVIEAVARDAAGRSASAAVTVQVVTGGPQVLILEPPDGVLTPRDRIDVAGVVPDGRRASADGTVTLTAGESGFTATVPIAADGSFRVPDVALAAGGNTLRAEVRDAQDRAGAATLSVVADFEPPAIAFFADGAPLGDGATFGRPIGLSVRVSDDAGDPPVPVVRLNGVVRAEAASPSTEIAVAEEGGYVVSVVASDSAGNETRAERSFLLDFGGCALSEIHPPAGSAVTGASIDLAGRSGSAAAVAVRVPDGAGGTQEYAAQTADGTFLAGGVPLPSVGANALVLVCTDAAGNERTQEHAIERLPAGDGPVVTIAAPADGALLDADAVTVSGTVSAGSVTVNGLAAAVTPGTGDDAFAATGVALVEGPNVLSARALDGAGRTGTDRVVVERDTQAPRVRITRPDHRSRVGRPGSGATAVDVGGIVDLDTEPNLEGVVVASAGGQVVASVDPATGAFVATGVPLDPNAGAETAQTLTATATDTLGHAGTSTADVYLDPAGPALVLDAPEDLLELGEGAPAALTVSGDAWAAEGAAVSVNGVDLDPASLAWEPAGADGRRHLRFTISIAVPDTDGAFGVIARVTEQDGDWAQDRRLLYRDTEPPRVVEMVPADGTGGVSPDSLVLVLFSEPVLHASLSGTDGLRLVRGSTGQPVVGSHTVAGQAVAFTPASALASGEGYVVRAGLGITDRAGNPLAAAEESAFTVAAGGGAEAPVLDPLPAVLCASEIVVTGTASPSSTLEVRDGDLVFRGNADATGRFSVPVPAAGSGYHLLRARALDPTTGAASAEATAAVRIDCSAPRVVEARFDRETARITVVFSEPVAPATVTVGDGSASVRIADAEAAGLYQGAALSFPGAATLALDLDPSPDAWWRDRPVRLQVGPPAADVEGNPMAAVFETVFFPGAGEGLAGGFLFGEAYDDTTGRPMAGGTASLYPAGSALPGTVAPGSAAAPYASAATDGRGRYLFAGDAPSGRYVLVLEAAGHVPVYRRLSLAPARGVVPFDSRLTPRGDVAGTIDPAAGGSVADGAVGLSADPGALAGTEPVDFRLTPLSGQGLPDFLPLGWTPAAVAEVHAEAAGAALPSGTVDWLPGAVRLDLPLPAWVSAGEELVAVRHEAASGRWISLPAPERLADGRVRVTTTGPGAVAVVVPDDDPATRPAEVPATEGEVLAGLDPAAPSVHGETPELVADLVLDPPVVPPTGRSNARVVARSLDGTTPWPSGLPVQAYLEEKLILAGGAGQLLEAPYSADLVLYHPDLAPDEEAGALPGAAGAVEFVVSPSPRAAQVLLDVGYENLRLFPFPEEIEREPVVGPPGGTVEGPQGVELTVPEGALAVRVPVTAELLDAAELAALPEVAGFDTLAAVRIDLQGQTLSRPATLSLPAPAGAGPDSAADPRLVVAERIDAPADGRGSLPRLASRARLEGSGEAARILASPDQAGSLPLGGLTREGLYLVLQARQPIGFVTGFVTSANGAALTSSRVTADGLGTADVTPAGGRYAIPAPAGSTGPTVRALHPTRDDQTVATAPALAAGQVVSLDLTLETVAPTVVSVAPADGAADQPVGSEVSVLFSEPLSGTTVGDATLTVELADLEGLPSGLRVQGSVALSPDGTRVVFTPTRPLVPGRTFLVRFAGGVADATGTFYEGAPVAWSFATGAVFVTGGQVHPERFHVRVPADGVAELYGEPGAVPGVPAGSTPWIVSPEIEAPAADPVRDSFAVAADGSFTGTVGHPPDFGATIASRVWVKVFDPSGTLAAEFRLGPFETADGLGFVAPGGEKVVFQSAEGIEVTVPAGAFDEATLVRVRQLDPSTLGVPTPTGMALGAYVDLDFKGRANEGLRLAIPAPADAAPGDKVFVGEPMALPWGRRLRILSVGGVESRADGNYLSNHRELQPAALQPGPLSEGTAVIARSSRTGEATLSTKELPPRTRANLLFELSLRGSAGWFHEKGATWTMAGGIVQSFGLYQEIAKEALYTKVADAWVYVPEPYDWNGGFLLPVLTDEPLEVVRRDTATGWILGESTYAAIPPGEDFVDVGLLEGDALARPLLIGARPFQLVRFQGPAEEETVSLTLEAEARGSTAGRVEVGGTGTFDLAAGTRLTLYDVTPALPRDPEAEPLAPIEGPAKTLCEDGSDWKLDSVEADEEMVLLVGPGDLHPASAGSFELQFDRPLDDLRDRPVAEVARLVDLGPFDGCTATGGSAYPRELPIVLDQTESGSRLVFEAVGALPAGHRFRLELEPAALVSRGSQGLSSWPSGPHRFEFGTRELDGEPLAGSPSGVPALGDTDVARDLLKLGNLLLVASENGRVLAIDASDTTDPQGLTGHSLMIDLASQIRTLGTDGHGRVFYAGQFGPLWAVKSFRIEDAREAVASCTGAPEWASGLPCFNGLKGSVRIAYVLGYLSGMTTSEWLAAGSMPTGTPMDLSILTQDEKGRALPLPELLEAYGAGDLASLTSDADGVYTFDLTLFSTVARGGTEPSQPPGTPPTPVAEWRSGVCASEEDYDRFQRVTLDNLTTGESWSIDVENPWPQATDGGGGTGSGTVQEVRARRGDRLRVRYNLRTLGHVALLGSGVTVVDLNRFYRLPQTQGSPGQGQCGRRLGNYQGQEIDWPACAPGSIDLYSGLSTLPAVETLGKTGCDEDGGGCRGTWSIDVYAPLMRIGALHAWSRETDPGSLSPSPELAACIGSVDGVSTVLRDVAVARDVPWADRGVRGTIDGTFQQSPGAGDPRSSQKPKPTDLLALSLGRAGIFVFDVSSRNILGPALVGHLRVPGHTAYRLQVDPVRHLLFAGGTDEASGEPIIDVWDLSSSNGAPKAGVRPVPVATLHTAWTTNHIGIDATDTGLVYTWDDEAGAQVAPFESPRFSFTGLYRDEDDSATEDVEPVEKPTTRFVPLGVPFHPEGAENRELADERDATAAFKVRVALPGALGPELTAKVQSLRVLPGERHLGKEDLGAAVLPPGAPSDGAWPENETIVRLRRLSPAGDDGTLGPTYHLYESVETVLLVADPRARRGYRRQDASAGEADEEGQCRRCDWPAYLPDPHGSGPELDRVKEVLAGRHVRVFLFADSGAAPVGGATAAEATRAAIAYFEDHAVSYPLPSGHAEVLAAAAAVPSPYQVALAEPAGSPAFWNAGEAGVAAALTGGELLLQATDHAVAGRSLPFVFSRSYRSGTLGYGPLGAAGWSSPLFARIRELPSGEAEYHDGTGRVWRFPPKAASAEERLEGYEEDPTSVSYDVPEGLYVSLVKRPGGIGWILQHPDNATVSFDGAGRLVEIADRLYRAGTRGDVGNRLRFGYDAFGHLVSIIDDLGRRYRLEYHDDPRPVSEGGDGPRYGLLRQVIDFADREVEYRWDEERRLTEVRLPEVANPTSAYGSFSYTGASRPTLTYAYDPAENVTASETATGALLHGDFAALRLASFELPDFLGGAATEPRASFAYDSSDGRLASVTFPGETAPATWTLESVGGAAPATSVTVTAPWGHAVEHDLEDGRVKVLRESLEVYEAGTGGGPRSLETVFDYTDDGRLTSTTRPDGSAESLCYADGEGGPGCPQEGSGESTRLRRPNVLARVVRATTPEAQGSADHGDVVTTVEYDDENLPNRIVDGKGRGIELPVPGVETADALRYEAEGISGSFTFDAFGRAEAEVWGGGETSRTVEREFGKDAAGRPDAGLLERVQIGSGAATGSSVDFEYEDDRFNVTTTTTSFGRRDRTTYDLWDRPVSEVMGESVGSLAAAGARGSCESSGARVERAFDAAGHLVRTRRLQDVAGPEGDTCRWVEERYTYNAREQLVSIERSHLADPSTPGAVLTGLRRTTELHYDEHGRLAETIALADAHGPVVTSYRYDPAGRPAGTTTGAEAERTVGYDARSRVVFQSDGDESTWEGRFDAWGRLYEESLPTGAKVTTRFDAAHQPVERTVTGGAPAAGEEPAVLAHSTYEVNSFGGVEEQRDDLTAAGGVRVTRQVFDDAGRVKLVAVGGTVPGGEGGEPVAVPERREVEIEYEPDSGRVLARKYGGSPGGEVLYQERYAYGLGAVPWPDAVTMHESVPGEGPRDTFTTTFTLDVFGRAIASQRTDGERRETMYERGFGAVLRASTGAGAETVITRDGRGLAVRTERPDGRGSTLTTYDLDGLPLVERTATADGATAWQTSHTYDATGRVTAVDYSDGTQETLTYHPDSTVATRTTRDGITLTYTYDPANRPLTVTPSGGTGTTRTDAGDAYAWDALSRPTRLERGRPGVGGLDPSLTLTYPSYDLGSRPAAETVGQREPLSWSWDVFDRPTSVRLPTGPGRQAGGAFTGFSRGYDSLDRLTSAGSLGGADPSPTALGADWQWGGLSRLYAMTTRGTLGTGVRLGYYTGAGPQVAGAPGGAPGSTAAWKLGRMSWGAAGGAGPTTAPATPWGDLGFGWRGHEGLASDGTKLGRQVLASAPDDPGVLSGQGWAWGYDGGVRMTVAESGPGSLAGVSTETGAAAADRFTYSYGTGDELLWSLRRETGEQVDFTAGEYGRITSREGVTFAHDPAGRRLSDDRFTYRWDWRGQLVEVTVHDTWPDGDGDGEPDVTPYAGHRVSYEYDARGRLHRRLHEGEPSEAGARPFIEERRYVWEMDRLAAEAGYGAPSTAGGDDGAMRWRKTYVPGPSGLDDSPQVVVEVYQPGPYSGTARTYTYVTDEMGTTLGLVAEDEGGTATEPPVPARYLYTPYGQAHAETGPELLRVRFDVGATSAVTAGGTVTQEVPDPKDATQGALVLTWSPPIDPASLPTGLHVERLAAGEGWVAVPTTELAIGTTPSADPLTDTSAELRVLRLTGWQEATSYRVRLTPELEDRLGRPFGRSETLQWSVPAAPSEEDDVPPPQYEQRYPRRYESYEAAGATVGGRFPGGQPKLFQGLYSDSVTGHAWARARWLDTRTGAWLSEDPLGAVDSPNRYAFVAWQPSMGTDPMGMCLGFNDEPCYVTANRWAGNLESARQRAEADGSGWVSIGLNTLSGSAIDLVELIAVDPLRAGASTGEAVGSGAGSLDIALATVEDVGRVAALAGGAGATLKAAGRGARGLRRAVSLSDELGDAVSAGVREGAAGVAAVPSRSASARAALADTAPQTLEEGVVTFLGREIKVPYTSKRLPVGDWGVTDNYGNIAIKRGLAGTRFFEPTLRHEAVHRFLSPRTGPFRNWRANVGETAQRSHLVKYLEEALAESFAKRSLYRGVRYPFEMSDPVSAHRLLLEGAGYLGGTSGLTYHAYRVAED
jgi:RHS repeat-associated protein